MHKFEEVLFREGNRQTVPVACKHLPSAKVCCSCCERLERKNVLLSLLITIRTSMPILLKAVLSESTASLFFSARVPQTQSNLARK